MTPDNQIEPEYRLQMQAMVKALDKVLNGEARGKARKTGFVLLVFPFGDVEGKCNYVSNGADREDIVCLMKEMIARFEGQPELRGNA